MPADQLILDLPVKPALGRADFFVSEANRAAVAHLERWREWPDGKLLIHGPAGAGKSHLAQVFAAESGARVVEAEALEESALPGLCEGPVAVENADRIAGHGVRETLLFHLHNMARAARKPLLLTARTPPARWAFTLPDLESRLRGALAVGIDPPDDALLAAMLVKLFADRQITVSPGLVSYLVARVERSFAALCEIVDALDRAALAEHRAITTHLAARVLDKH